MANDHMQYEKRDTQSPAHSTIETVQIEQGNAALPTWQLRIVQVIAVVMFVGAVALLVGQLA